MYVGENLILQQELGNSHAIFSGSLINAWIGFIDFNGRYESSTGNRFNSAQVEIYDEVRRTVGVIKHMVPKAGIEPALP